MTKTFDPTKPVATCDGREARIICTDKKGKHPIVALVAAQNDEEISLSFDAEGRHMGYEPSPASLVNVIKRTSRFENVFVLSKGSRQMGGVLHSSMGMAREKDYSSKLIGTIEYVYEDGVFVDIVWHKEEEGK
jgi:hypothetical protein